MDEPQPIERTFTPLYAVRPSRLQLALARLWLTFFARRPRPLEWSTLIILALMAAASVVTGLVGTAVIRGRSDDATTVCASSLCCLAVLSSVLLARWRARADLVRDEMDGGALIGFDARGLIWAERGSTLFCAHELVAVHESPFGLIVELPWRRIGLIPAHALSPIGQRLARGDQVSCTSAT